MISIFKKSDSKAFINTFSLTPFFPTYVLIKVQNAEFARKGL